MEVLLRNQWAQLATVGIVAVLLGLVVSAALFSAGPSDPTLGPVKLTTGGSVHSILPNNPRASRQIVDEELPLTAAEAVAAGWKDPILCSTGRGRYFQKTGGEEVPYLLMYDAADQLTGMYMVQRDGDAGSLGTHRADIGWRRCCDRLRALGAGRLLPRPY